MFTVSRWVAEIASWAMEWPEGHWTGCCLCLSAVAANSLIHYWSSYMSVGVDQYWIFTERWNVNFQTFWQLTFHWSVKKHPLGNKVNKCRNFLPFLMWWIFFCDVVVSPQCQCGCDSAYLKRWHGYSYILDSFLRCCFPDTSVSLKCFQSSWFCSVKWHK